MVLTAGSQLLGVRIEMSGSKSSQEQRVLLMDDEPVIVATLADGLRRAGFDVTATTAAAEALEHVRQATFALAILDYAMPGQNGLEAAALLTKLHQPFMFLSAYSDPELVDQAIIAGALAYVVKPIDPVQLIPTVRAAAQRAQEISALLEQTERLSKAIDTNRDVSVAVGLLMAQRGLSRRVAYETLRQHARRTRRRLSDLAAEITVGAEALYAVPVAELADAAKGDTGTESDSGTP
jgi:AmiR/NasT family two-component response regulator